MTTLNWDDNEAVVRAAVPDCHFSAGGPDDCMSGVWESGIGGFMGDDWAEARQHPTVRAWEQENRLKDWEEAKRKVLERWPDARFAEMNCGTGGWRIVVTRKNHAWRLQELSDYFTASQESAAWINAASKLEPVGEEPKKVCKYGNPCCPCQDGDPCHYEGENPMPAPSPAREARETLLSIGDKIASEFMRPDFASSGYSFKKLRKLADQWIETRTKEASNA